MSIKHVVKNPSPKRIHANEIILFLVVYMQSARTERSCERCDNRETMSHILQVSSSHPTLRLRSKRGSVVPHATSMGAINHDADVGEM